MNIIPVEIQINLLYENRHLYTDDSQYNSLIVSNLINKNIELLDYVNYNALLDNNIKQRYVFETNPRFNYILSKDGVYRQKGVLLSYFLGFYHWEDITGRTTQTIDILTVVV